MHAAMYQVVFLGSRDNRIDRISETVRARLNELGLGSDVITFLDEVDVGTRDLRLPTLGVFLGYAGADDARHPSINGLLSDSNVIIPVVSDVRSADRELPASLRHINASQPAAEDAALDSLASIVLESFRLLRRERRLFISYKRDDSRATANQLYDALDTRGFDVFIDTRSVPPGKDFQAELWHRLSDSDVVILIDTTNFRKSRWTTEELTRANATNIQILHLLWPGQKEDSASAFSHFFSLIDADFEPNAKSDAEKRLLPPSMERICLMAERLRARAIAARHRYLVDGFCDAARDRGLTANVQPRRWISVDLPSGKQLAAVPTVGVPTSIRINEVFNEIANIGGGTGGTWVLYDNRGILTSWLQHLEWLDGYLPVKSVKVSWAEKALKGLAT
jgi:hypothetical protein